MRYLIAFILISLFWLGYSFILSAFSSFEIASGLAAGGIGAGALYLFDRYLKPRFPRAERYLLAVVLVVLLVILGGAIWLWFKALPVDTLATVSGQPALDYNEAVNRVAVMQADEEDDILPVCRTQLLTHGHKTEKAVVFLHGLSNCPAQFSELGQLFYEQGYNVFIPRMPYHGYTNRMRTDQSHMTAEQLVAYNNEVADIAQGLGDETIVAGFSAGGVLAAWLAQNRADIDHVVLISPVLGLASVPTSLTGFAAKTLLALPNFYVWWNPAEKEDLPGLGSPRFSSHALAQLLRLSESVQLQADQHPPQVDSILAVINKFDFAVSGDEVVDLTERWQQHDAPVETYTIPWDNFWTHDFIDPNVPQNQPAVVNALLFEIITGHVE